MLLAPVVRVSSPRRRRPPLPTRVQSSTSVLPELPMNQTCYLTDHSSSSDQLETCLFVANLPQRLTNAQLANALLEKFSPFGPIVAVKASRDQRGRPFGFVEYVYASSAQAVLAAANNAVKSSDHPDDLTIHFRRIRVEMARCQRKICIKRLVHLQQQHHHQPSRQEDQLILEMREELVRLARPEDLKLSLHRQPGIIDSSQLLIVAVVKFEDRDKADSAFALWSRYPEWTVSWITTDHMAHSSNVRASGLVQLVPHEQQPPQQQQQHVIIRPDTLKSINNIFVEQQEPTVVFLGPHEGNNGSFDSFDEEAELATILKPQTTHGVTRTFEECLYASIDPKVHWQPDTLFVGRLNSQKVTLEMLKERFSIYGNVTYIRLFMRGMIGLDGVPLDSFAFIIYQQQQQPQLEDSCNGDQGPPIVVSNAVQAAINEQHGAVWLGQTIKCEPALHIPFEVNFKQ